MAFLSSSEEDLRHAVSDQVREICSGTETIIYGSFSNGTFHLDVENWISHSDLDLISSDAHAKQLSTHISLQIKNHLDLAVQTKIRRNISHIDKLPVSVSRQLAFVDTAISFARGIETRSHFHYLLVKYLLRAVYLDRYLGFDEDMLRQKYHFTENEGDIFFLLMQFKLAGTHLMHLEFARIVAALRNDTRHLHDLMALLSLRDINDVIPYWRSFATNATTFGLNDLIDDISHKIDFAKQVERGFRNAYARGDGIFDVDVLDSWALTLRSTNPTRNAQADYRHVEPFEKRPVFKLKVESR